MMVLSVLAILLVQDCAIHSVLAKTTSQFDTELLMWCQNALEKWVITVLKSYLAPNNYKH